MDPNVSQQPEIEPKPHSSSNILVILLGIIVVLGLIAGAYYLGTKQQGKVAAVSPAPTNIPTNNSSPTPDPTANWKTYSDGVSFSIKYPGDWILKGEAGIIEFLDPSSMKYRMGNGGGMEQIYTRFVDVYIINSTESVKSYVDTFVGNQSPSIPGPYNGVDLQRHAVMIGTLSGEIFPGEGEGVSGYYLVVSDGKGHILNFNIPTSYPSKDQEINEILSTLKFTQ